MMKDGLLWLKLFSDFFPLHFLSRDDISTREKKKKKDQPAISGFIAYILMLFLRK